MAHAQLGLPTPTPTAQIMLNDITAVGSAVASDDPRVPAQPPPLDTPHGEAEVVPHGEIGEGDLPGDNIGCTDGQCLEGGMGAGDTEEGGDDDPCRLVCETDEPWRLFGRCCTLQRNRLDIRGWISGGYTANFQDPASNFNGPVTFNDRDEVQLNQSYLILERAIDTECSGWDLGGRVDLLYGTDHRFTLSRGLDAEDDFTSSWHTNRFYGLAMPQAYGEVGVQDVSIKLGHFYTIIGYEVVTAPDNFFYSHAYTHMFGEPFTHTGAMATWTPNEHLSVIGGGTYGWDNFEDVYDDVSFLGGVTFTASDKNSKLALAMHTGDEEQAFGTVEPNDERTVYSIVYSSILTDRISWVFEHDHGWQENALGSGESAEWYGLNQYLFYKINCCWTLGTRLEWFRDDDGFRVAPAGDYPALGASTNPTSAGGFEGSFWALTAGLNYKPTGNLTIRPELRYDWYDGRPNAAGHDPFDDGGKDHQWLAAFDVIYLY
ncbi:MAG: porin [Pirellulales bacterium]